MGSKSGGGPVRLSSHRMTFLLYIEFYMYLTLEGLFIIIIIIIIIINIVVNYLGYLSLCSL